MINRVFGNDVIDPETGEIIVEQGQVFTEEHYEQFSKDLQSLNLILIASSGYVFQPTIAMTLTQDSCYSVEDALKRFMLKLWPGDSCFT